MGDSWLTNNNNEYAEYGKFSEIEMAVPRELPRQILADERVPSEAEPLGQYTYGNSSYVQSIGGSNPQSPISDYTGSSSCSGLEDGLESYLSLSHSNLNLTDTESEGSLLVSHSSVNGSAPTEEKRTKIKNTNRFQNLPTNPSVAGPSTMYSGNSNLDLFWSDALPPVPIEQLLLNYTIDLSEIEPADNTDEYNFLPNKTGNIQAEVKTRKRKYTKRCCFKKPPTDSEIQSVSRQSPTSSQIQPKQVDPILDHCYSAIRISPFLEQNSSSDSEEEPIPISIPPKNSKIDSANKALTGKPSTKGPRARIDAAKKIEHNLTEQARRSEQTRHFQGLKKVIGDEFFDRTSANGSKRQNASKKDIIIASQSCISSYMAEIKNARDFFNIPMKVKKLPNPFASDDDCQFAIDAISDFDLCRLGKRRGRRC